MKHDEAENISQKLLKTIIDLIPKYDKEELNKKIGTLTSKKKTPKLSEIKLEKNNEIKLPIVDTQDSLIKSYATTVDGDVHSKCDIKPKKIDGKNISEHISLMEENEEEDLIDDSIHENIRKKRKQLKKTQKDILNQTFCGKKRNNSSKKKNIDLSEQKSKEKRKRKNSAELSKNKRSTKKNDNINPLFKQKEEERKTMTEKEKLVNLFKRKGFMKVFECLTKTQLNREKPLEKNIDDIISSIGLLRTALILLEIKFKEIDQNKNINTNNIININSNSNNISTDVPKIDDDIDIVIDEISDSQETKYIKTKTKTPINRKKNKSLISKNSKRSNRNEFLTKSKSVIRKDLSKKDLEFDVHLHKDKNGNIYKYYKQHYRENKGKSIYVFRCPDRKCMAKANYYIGNMAFEIVKDHTIKYEEHNYIQNKKRFDKYKQIIEEFEQRDCHQAQVFKKENGTRLVKWYD